MVAASTEKQIAKAEGRKTYNTGKPCKHGHFADRFIGKGDCCECNRLRCLAVPLEKRQARWKAWYAKNREARREYKRDPKFNAANAKWAKDNPDKVKAIYKRYCRNNREYLRAKNRNREALKRASGGKHT